MGGKPRSYSRRKYREQQREFLRTNDAVLAAAATLVLLLCVVAWALLDGYVLGLLQGLVVAIFGGLIVTLFHAKTGSIWQLMGAWGEENTHDELASAQRRGRIWGWVDNIEVQAGDIDHLVLMRDGRIVALDSKWHATDLTTQVLQQDARKATAAARQASLILRSLNQPRAVTPVVVLWGKTSPSAVPEDANVDGVDFVAGRGLTQWLERNDGADVREADAEVVLTALQEFKSRVRPDFARRS